MMRVVTPLVGGRLGRTLSQGRVDPWARTAIDARQYNLKRRVENVQKSFLNIQSQ